MALAAAAYERTGEKQRVFADLSYGARSWNKERRVIARLEHGPRLSNSAPPFDEISPPAKSASTRRLQQDGNSIFVKVQSVTAKLLRSIQSIQLNHNAESGFGGNLS